MVGCQQRVGVHAGTTVQQPLGDKVIARGQALNLTIAMAACYAEAAKSNEGIVPPMTTDAAPGSVPTAGGPRPSNAAVFERRANVKHALWGGVAAVAAANAAGKRTGGERGWRMCKAKGVSPERQQQEVPVAKLVISS